MPVKKKILIAAMDWGLGHATRLVPIIRKHEQNGEEVLLASAGKAFDFWKVYFPQLKILEKPGYEIKYPENGSMIRSIFFQLPRIFSTIIREHFWLKKIIRKHDITKIVSDNCYGLWNKNIKSVFITHQLNVIVPGRIPFLNSFINKIILTFVKKYDECLVPDMEDTFNYTGLLTHLKKKPKNVKFIGIQSRFEKDLKISETVSYDLLVILSGPEPQRTLLENRIANIWKVRSESCCIIRGNPGKENLEMSEQIDQAENIVWYNHVDDHTLKSLLVNAKKIVCRSGYSTIMDLVTLNAKALLIPTPGQTEQEYLANYNSDKKLFKWKKQDLLSVDDLIEEDKKNHCLI